jgi:hypothetical protein
VLSNSLQAAQKDSRGEFVETQLYNADRAEARVNLGAFYGNRGDAARAEEEIKTAFSKPWRASTKRVARARRRSDMPSVCGCSQRGQTTLRNENPKFETRNSRQIQIKKLGAAALQSKLGISRAKAQSMS